MSEATIVRCECAGADHVGLTVCLCPSQDHAGDPVHRCRFCDHRGHDTPCGIRSLQPGESDYGPPCLCAGDPVEPEVYRCGKCGGGIAARGFRLSIHLRDCVLGLGRAPSGGSET